MKFPSVKSAGLATIPRELSDGSRMASLISLHISLFRPCWLLNQTNAMNGNWKIILFVLRGAEETLYMIMKFACKLFSSREKFFSSLGISFTSATEYSFMLLKWFIVSCGVFEDFEAKYCAWKWNMFAREFNMFTPSVSLYCTSIGAYKRRTK